MGVSQTGARVRKRRGALSGPFATMLGGLVARAGLRLPYLIAGGVTLIATLVGARLLLEASRHTEPER